MDVYTQKLVYFLFSISLFLSYFYCGAVFFLVFYNIWKWSTNHVSGYLCRRKTKPNILWPEYCFLVPQNLLVYIHIYLNKNPAELYMLIKRFTKVNSPLLNYVRFINSKGNQIYSKFFIFEYMSICCKNCFWWTEYNIVRSITNTLHNRRHIYSTVHTNEQIKFIYIHIKRLEESIHT